VIDKKSRHDGHEEREGHEGCECQEDLDRVEATEERETRFGSYRLHVPSRLTPRAEEVMTETIGCAIAVHRELGPGFIEPIYHKAMRIELEGRKLAFESERAVVVNYRGAALAGQRVDLIVEGLIVVELKAVIRLDEIHRRQLVSYLRTVGLRGGLLINFRVAVLKNGGIRRVVL
jgi:GxxExxY protein